jgi:hypothetical protein
MLKPALRLPKVVLPAVARGGPEPFTFEEGVLRP